MTGRVLMVQGTASHVGKSLLVAALCRIFRQDGYQVAPFKAQNMSLNSFVTPEGGEIGRAQAVQAEAAGIAPSVDMNPVLLKPEADARSQVVVLGRPYLTASAADYYNLKSVLWPQVTAALERLRQRYQVVVIEGAGSPAEVNLARDEIVNMRVARHAAAPVLLVGDIDRGGVFASLVGTLELLEPVERALIKAFVINKFRGDVKLLEPGLRFLEGRTGLPVAGVIPWSHDIRIAEEDALGLERPQAASRGAAVDVAVIQVPHLSNFDDFDPLKHDAVLSPSKEPGAALRYVASPEQLGDPDLVILPGSKTTMADLAWLRQQGLAGLIVERHQQGAFIVGICGGYQMLGQRILDPQHVESAAGEAQGLGLLPLTTTFSAHKETHQVTGQVVSNAGMLAGARGAPIGGYEIHMGATCGPVASMPFSLRQVDGSDQQPQPEGAMDATGRVLGTYVHGLFHNADLKRVLLRNVALARGKALPLATPGLSNDVEYDKLAALVRRSLDMELIYNIAGLKAAAHRSK